MRGRLGWGAERTSTGAIRFMEVCVVLTPLEATTGRELMIGGSATPASPRGADAGLTI